MPDSIIKADNISSLSGGGIGFPDGSVSNPSLKFTNDGDTGLYRIGSNTIGISSGGNKVSEIGEFGLLNGLPFVDYKNLINVKEENLDAVGANSTSTVFVGTGNGFSYTPKSINSILRIHIIIPRISQVYSSGSGGNGFSALYQNKTGILTVGETVTGSNLVETEVYSMNGDGKNQAENFNFIFHYSNLDLDTKFFSYTHRTNLGTVPVNVTAGSRFLYICEEYI